MIETTLVGETAARCMGYMDDHEALDGGEILAVMMIVVAQNAKGDQTFTRTFSSDTTYYKQVGLMAAGMECVVEGYRTTSTGEGLDDDDDADE